MGQTINPFGKDIIKVSTEFCGRELSIETNRVAFKSNTVWVRYGDNVVAGTGLASDKPRAGADYFPLMIDYEEKMYAAGKISGSRFVKREGRPSEDAILTARLIDRPIRPLFPKGYVNEVQGIATVYSMDPDLKPDAIGMIAVSTALMLTGAPFEGPVGGVRIALVDGELIAYPTKEQMLKSKLDLTVAGTEDAIMMVEAGADEVDEETMVKALQMAHEAIQPVIALQNELVEKMGVVKQEFEVVADDPELKASIQKAIDDKEGPHLRHKDTHTREEAVRELREEVVEQFASEEEEGPSASTVKEIFAHLMKHEVRRGVLEDGVRPDERGPEDIRQISSEVGMLPRAHGSSIFTRGLTQAVNVVTLASASFGQVIDTMERDEEKHFIHHYNFPGYSVGEIKRLMGAGRREIGHGALAERALAPVIPSQEDFPYTIRTVSELQSAAGSTSMASVCSGCLALMDAGVPITKPVSGIAMGLMSDDETGKKVILTDIMDQEDFAGDMDFKVAGTADGITALQMDMKVKGLSADTLRAALEQAKVGRAKIMENMMETLSEPRKEMSPYAPRIETVMVDPDKVKIIIGKGGEMINRIIDETGVEIDIKDGGIVMVAAADQKARDAAVQWIKDLTAEPEVGAIYESTVVSVKDFGVFVEFMPGKEGLVHVSEMADERIDHPGDLVKEGDKGPVKLLAIDDQGRYKLSMKEAK